MTHAPRPLPVGRSRPGSSTTLALATLALVLLALCLCLPAQAVEFDQYPGELGSAKADLSLMQGAFPGADRTEPVPSLSWPVNALYRGDELLGYAFESAEVAPIPAYSGKPVNLLIAIDPSASLRLAKVLDHSEPIMLVGIPGEKLDTFASQHQGASVETRLEVGEDVDAISGATVTVIVVNDTIMRSARQVAAALGLIADPAARPIASVRTDIFAPADWPALHAQGALGHLMLTQGEVDDAFIGTPAEHYLSGQRPPRGATFIDLYLAYLNAPTIGRNLLGERGYDSLMESLAPGEHAIALLADGSFSYKGSGYVRGGIFDRIELVQGNASISFHDHDQRRLAQLAIDAAPTFSERDIFIVREGAHFDPGEPWRLNLLVRRASGPLTQEFTRFHLEHRLPEAFIERPEPVDPTPLWLEMWQQKRLELVGLGVGLLILSLILTFQNALARRPQLLRPLRKAFLLYTLVYIGWVCLAQLSVVNVLTLTHALMHGFHWSAFLIDPLMFVLWVFVAATLVLWGRSVFCGWLCPFGALQDLVNQLARHFKVPQVTLPFSVHQRLWVIKYLILFGLVGVSFYDLAQAERLAEVEPFKTAITLHFLRDWGYVLYAVALIASSAFMHKAYCRYVCPLGASLAIAGRIRLFDWLRRHRGQCGTPCQICANDCELVAIYPDGRIEPSECHYCLDCQITFDDDRRCPPQVKRRKRLERDGATARASGSDAETRGSSQDGDPRRIPCLEEN
ncbi:NosR/NirI family protein [Halomonas denitrificans]|uniref:NosR/NirI family protein n=1 Tax=Halomonas denitrificans TaxID=370769 RepID=UPI001CD6336B|nr:NosR/NirI family protein [Halomonas denitrificans]MCA0974373.1 NosR/NirI family protein [Halomonas denitrificans]